MHFAARYGYTDIVKLIIEKNETCLAQKNNIVWTALHLAARYGETGVATLIIEKYPEGLTEKDDSGLTALQIARQSGHTRTAEAIESFNKATNDSSPAISP